MGRLGLRHHHATGFQGPGDLAIKLLQKETHRRSHRVGAVDDDQIKGPLVLINVADAVLKDDLGAGMLNC